MDDIYQNKSSATWTAGVPFGRVSYASFLSIRDGALMISFKSQSVAASRDMSRQFLFLLGHDLSKNFKRYKKVFWRRPFLFTKEIFGPKSCLEVLTINVLSSYLITGFK